MAGSRQRLEALTKWGHGEIGSLGFVGEMPRQTGNYLRQRVDDRAQVSLARAIEGEVIPRLMLTHQVGGAKPGSAVHGAPPAPHEVLEFSRIALTQPVDVGLAYLDAMRFRGVSLETLLLDVIAPAARHLGELWTADLCDFTDVTVGLTRLQQMLCELSPTFEGEHRTSTRRALLMACPGEQHSLGLFMVQEFFRRSGWHVHPVAPQTEAELAHLVATQRFDVIGFSASCEVAMERLTSVVGLARKKSKNRAVGVLVGGSIFNRHPEFVARVGADATATDGKQAVMRLPALLGLKANC